MFTRIQNNVFTCSAPENSHRRVSGSPQHDPGPHRWREVARGRAEGSPPRPPPPATPLWRRRRGTRTRCAECSRLESWWAPRPARSRSSCSDTASGPSASAAPPRRSAALGRAVGWRAAAARPAPAGNPSPRGRPSSASSGEGSRPRPAARTYTQQEVQSVQLRLKKQNACIQLNQKQTNRHLAKLYCLSKTLFSPSTLNCLFTIDSRQQCHHGFNFVRLNVYW